MTEAIVERYRQKIDRVVLKPSSGGRFEVTIDGDLVHSKAATKQYPSNEAMIAEVDKRLAEAAG